MPFLLAIALLAGQNAVEVHVTTVDERAISGQVDAWDANGIAIVSDEDRGTETLRLPQVLRVDFEPSNPTVVRGDTQRPAITVNLANDAQLTGNSFRTTDGRFKLEGAIGETAIDAPLDAVKCVRLMPLPDDLPTLASEWRDLLAMKPAGDLIVIRKAGAANLNFVEGTLGDVGADRVQFSLDDQVLEVKRNKVFGLIYYRGPSPGDDANYVAAITGPGLRLTVTEVAIEGTNVVATTPHLGRIQLPTSAIRSVDFSIDRLQYLSDLAPTRMRWTPPPGATPLSPLFSNISIDRGFYSPKLQLEYPADSLPPEELTSAGLPQRVKFAKGLAIRSRSELSYRVPKGFATFRATAGIDPSTRATGAVQLTVLGDNKPLVQSTIAGTDEPLELECNVHGMREVTIIVGFDSKRGFAAGMGGNLHLGGARFIK